MVRIDQALYERIVALARQHRRSIRAQTSLLLERALEHVDGPLLEAPQPYWMKQKP